MPAHHSSCVRSPGGVRWRRFSQCRYFSPTVGRTPAVKIFLMLSAERPSTCHGSGGARGSFTSRPRLTQILICTTLVQIYHRGQGLVGRVPWCVAGDFGGPLPRFGVTGSTLVVSCVRWQK